LATELLPLHKSVAVIVKVFVMKQPFVLFVEVTTTVGVLQKFVAFTRAVMLATVGSVPEAGLQPRYSPVVGTPVIVGALVSTVQL
jgi:hypothetical protein